MEEQDDEGMLGTKLQFTSATGQEMMLQAIFSWLGIQIGGEIGHALKQKQVVVAKDNNRHVVLTKVTGGRGMSVRANTDQIFTGWTNAWMIDRCR